MSVPTAPADPDPNLFNGHLPRTDFQEELVKTVLETAVSEIPEIGGIAGSLMGLFFVATDKGSAAEIERYIKDYCNYAVLKQVRKDREDDLLGFMAQLREAGRAANDQMRAGILKDLETALTREFPHVNYRTPETPVADASIPARDMLVLFGALAVFHLNVLGQLARIDPDETSRHWYKDRLTDRRTAYRTHATNEMARAKSERQAKIAPLEHDRDPSLATITRGPVGETELGRSDSFYVVRDADRPDLTLRARSYDDGMQMAWNYNDATLRLTENFYLQNVVGPIAGTTVTRTARDALVEINDRLYSALPVTYCNYSPPRRADPILTWTSRGRRWAYDPKTGDMLSSTGDFDPDAHEYDLRDTKGVEPGLRAVCALGEGLFAITGAPDDPFIETATYEFHDDGSCTKINGGAMGGSFLRLEQRQPGTLSYVAASGEAQTLPLEGNDLLISKL
ncbi:hypothetical protein [Pseudaestuariivita atlantica]|uniref:Uncharacterized protein n=1 Tax=Pseudaestuariivita atlantica TaxID=1317121 RepID=A0A0L1JKR6_9RHOB|nr:hypothetical protein [Pseudaestuariivita atlantica]KNG92346.1 hypothetical protein ATO11_17165 [Pseudaestuariivita atlantica]